MPKRNRGRQNVPGRTGMSWAKTSQEEVRLIMESCTYSAMRVYQYMLFHHDTKSGRIHPTTYEKIGDYVGISSRSVAGGVAELVQVGIFEPSPKADVRGTLTSVVKAVEESKKRRSNSSGQRSGKKKGKKAQKPPPSPMREIRRR